jgi:hypothetical protein
MPDELIAEIPEDVQAVGREIGEEVLKILFLVGVDAKTDDSGTHRFVELPGSQRANLR